MSAQGQNVINQIYAYVRNYAVEAFHDLRLQRILLQLVGLADTSGGGVSPSTGGSLVPVTSANFINATDCPLIALDGANLQIFFNENQRFLEKDAGEWTDLAGGGFRVLLTGFDSTTALFHFKVYTY